MKYIQALNEEFCMCAMNVCTRNDAIRARSCHIYSVVALHKMSIVENDDGIL